MVKIFYYTNKDKKVHQLLFNNNIDIVYDLKRDQFPLFIKHINFSDEDFDKEVCLQTINKKLFCYRYTITNLNLDQIINITLRRAVPEIADFILPPHNITSTDFSDFASSSPQTVFFPHTPSYNLYPSYSESVGSYDLTPNIRIDNSLTDQLNSQSYSQFYGDINTDTTLPLNTGPEPEPNNDDKSKDETSLWMFLTNNLWLLIIIGIVIIISVYVYMTFQERTEAYKTSIFGNGML